MIKNRITIIRGAKFDVHTTGIIRLLTKDDGPLGRFCEIEKGERVTVTSIDFYVNRVYAKWRDKDILMDYDFVVRNLLPSGPILTSTVQALEVIECMPENTESEIPPLGLYLGMGILIGAAICLITLCLSSFC